MKKKTGSSSKSGASKSVKDLRPRATKEKTANAVRGGITVTKTTDSSSSNLYREALTEKRQP